MLVCVQSEERDVTIDGQTVTLLGILVAVIGSAWKTNSSIGDLRERMARLEGRMDTLESVIVQVFRKRETE